MTLAENADDVKTDDDFSLPNFTLPKNREYRPDLIESNTDVCSNLTEFGRAERHLPDIASANIEPKDENANFDLICDSVDREARDEEPRKEVIRFPIASDVPEDELHQYLEELEESVSEEATDSQFLAADVGSVEATSRGEVTYEEGNKISIAVEADSSRGEKAKVNQEIEEISKTEAERALVAEEVDNAEGADIENLAADVADGLKVEYVIEATPGSVEDSTGGFEETEVNFEDDESRRNEMASEFEELTTDSNSEECNLNSADAATACEVDHSVDLESRVEPNLLVDKESEIEEKSISDRGTDVNDVNELPRDRLEAEMDVRNVTPSECTQDGSVQASDTNYQILDSRMAISTFDVNESASSAVIAENGDSDAGEQADKTSERPKLQRPDSLNLLHTTQNSEMSSTSAGIALMSSTSVGIALMSPTSAGIVRMSSTSAGIITLMFRPWSSLGFKPIPECANLDSRVSDQGKIRDSTIDI